MPCSALTTAASSSLRRSSSSRNANSIRARRASGTSRHSTNAWRGALHRRVELDGPGQRDLGLHRARRRVEDLARARRPAVPGFPSIQCCTVRIGDPSPRQPRARRAARRWPSSVATASTMMLPNRIIDASTLICGGVAVRDCAEDPDRERRRARAGDEERDDEVVERQREREQRRGEDPGDDQRQRDPEERARRVRAEVHRRVLERPVEAAQPRLAP